MQTTDAEVTTASLAHLARAYVYPQSAQIRTSSAPTRDESLGTQRGTEIKQELAAGGRAGGSHFTDLSSEESSVERWVRQVNESRGE